MHFRPILSTLLRHKIASTLIVLEIALTCAIICNAIYLIADRAERIQRPTGLVDNELVIIRMAPLGESEHLRQQVVQDTAALRALPGVRGVSYANQVPFGGSSWNTSVRLHAQQQNESASVGLYLADEGFLDTFGLELVQGRYFNAEEYLNWEEYREPGSDLEPSVVVLSSDLAQQLFPDGDALGQTLTAWGEDGLRIVGIVQRLIRPNDAGGEAQAYLTMVMPVRFPHRDIVIRTDPELRTEIMERAIAELETLNPRRILIFSGTFSDIVSDWYQNDRAMVWMMVMVIVALLVVTALGIVGLASFWVAQRTKQIGVRRALGATRGQILRYFQTENFLLTTLGIVLGMIGAYAINQWLMTHYELARLPALFLPIGAVVLWSLGQIAVFGPARRAASVPPAVATRSV